MSVASWAVTVAAPASERSTSRVSVVFRPRRRLLARLDDLVVEPSHLELPPGAHVAGPGADVVRDGVEPRPAGHQAPEAGAVVAPGGVVEVRQAEVVGELVGEDTQPAVLRLGRVVTDPDARVAERHTAELVAVGPRPPQVGGVGVPAVAPDGVLALGAVAGLLPFAGVDRLEVVDVAVRLVEVAVTVVVVPVPDVVVGEVVADLGVAPALVLLVLVPGLGGVLDVVPVAVGLARAITLDGVVAVRASLSGTVTQSLTSPVVLKRPPDCLR